MPTINAYTQVRFKTSLLQQHPGSPAGASLASRFCFADSPGTPASHASGSCSWHYMRILPPPLGLMSLSVTLGTQAACPLLLAAPLYCA